MPLAGRCGCQRGAVLRAGEHRVMPRVMWSSALPRGRAPTRGGWSAREATAAVIISLVLVSIKALHINLRKRKSNWRENGAGFSPTNYHLNRSVQ